jgi:tetratricopeptide (TPR) repeat protein
MILLFAAAALQTVSGPALSGDERYHDCIEAATSDPAKGELDAQRWKAAGGGLEAQQCLGVALANQERWIGAAGEFEAAARNAALANDERQGQFWAQAGNSWLAAGETAKAQRAFGAALDSGTLSGLARGEAHLDRARALVAAGDLAAARIDLDAALADAAADPLAWLLSATLARRMNDWPRARKDIAEALARAPDDAAVQLEAGNIAAASGDEDAAKAAWDQALRLAPESPAGRAAGEALQQFSRAPTR